MGETEADRSPAQAVAMKWGDPVSWVPAAQDLSSKVGPQPQRGTSVPSKGRGLNPLLPGLVGRQESCVAWDACPSSFSAICLMGDREQVTSVLSLSFLSCEMG